MLRSLMEALKDFEWLDADGDICRAYNVLTEAAADSDELALVKGRMRTHD